jgi:hypothetical protein
MKLIIKPSQNEKVLTDVCYGNILKVLELIF